MYIVNQKDVYYLIETDDELANWAETSMDEDGDNTFDGCPYMQFEFKPTGKIKVLPAEPRRFQLVKKK